MDIRKLQRAIVDGLEDVKAQNIAVFNTEHLSPLFERGIIASARGPALRLAPHFFNTLDEVDHAVDTLAQVLDAAAG